MIALLGACLIWVWVFAVVDLIGDICIDHAKWKAGL